MYDYEVCDALYLVLKTMIKIEMRLAIEPQ